MKKRYLFYYKKTTLKSIEVETELSSTLARLEAKAKVMKSSSPGETVIDVTDFYMESWEEITD